MKHKIKALMIALAIVLPLNIFAAENAEVNVSKSVIEWEGKKVTGAHNGTVSLKSGFVSLEKGALVGGEFLIDMTSIKNLDLTDAETNAKLVGHLKSDDFFSVSSHPTAKLVIKNVAPISNAKKGEANYTITADLTIKGITNQIKFPAIVTVTGKSAYAWAKFTIDRSKWNVKYGSGSFFDNLGDKVIYDDMNFVVKLFTK